MELVCPAELWGRVAQYMSPREFLRLCRCTPNLLVARERQNLWRLFCIAEGYARLVVELPADNEHLCSARGALPPDPQQRAISSTAPPGPAPPPVHCQTLGVPQGGRDADPRWWSGAEVDWQRCFQVNSVASATRGGRHVFAVVRIRGEELRVPADVGEGDDSRDSLQQEWLMEHGWRPPAALKHAVLRVLVPCQVPLRFRELVVGRPGLPIRRARFFAGGGPASAMAEWPIGRSPNGAWVWPMPPHEDDPESATPAARAEAHFWKDDGGLLPGPHPWLRSRGWLVELVAEPRQPCVATTFGGGSASRPGALALPMSPDASLAVQCAPESPGASDCSPVESASAAAMAASRAFWYGGSAPRRWVHIGRDKAAESITVRELCHELRRHLPLLGFGWSAKVYPASTRQPGRPAEPLRPGWLLHADLRWTQGERLYLSEATLPAATLPGRPDADAWAEGPEAPSGASAVAATGDGGSAVGRRTVVLFRRDAVRSPRNQCLKAAVSCSAAGLADAQEAAAVASNRRLALVDHSSEAMMDDSRFRRGAPFEEAALPSGEAVAEQSGECDRRPMRRSAMTAPEVAEDEVVPHARRLLLSSSGVRQFEFHPTRPGTLLAGRKDGVIAVLDHKADTLTHVLEVDSYPILGLAWLHTQPQWAVVGASQSGTTCMVRYDESTPGCMEHVRLEPFPHLSSLSVCCTDDYFMTSGFSVDVGLYDIVTGRRTSTFRGLHQSFINILRFANCSPHLFATASFDHTCKLWDLREPILANQPARAFNTDTLNVMCCFSPDDRHILCSGVDQALQQFPLGQNSTAPVGTRFPLPALRSDTNYRRSLYLANGRWVATAATNESLLRLYTTEAPHRHVGHVDLKGMLRWRRQYAGLPTEEYVQSLRCHPSDPRLIGALLSTSEPHLESYIAMLRLG